MEGPGLGRRGREASLLIPLVFVTVGRGRERKSPGVGVPRPPKGRDGPRSPGLWAHPIRRARSMPATWCALQWGRCIYRLLRPVSTALRLGGLCRIKTGYIGCESPTG